MYSTTTKSDAVGKEQFLKVAKEFIRKYDGGPESDKVLKLLDGLTESREVYLLLRDMLKEFLKGRYKGYKKELKPFYMKFSESDFPNYLVVTEGVLAKEDFDLLCLLAADLYIKEKWIKVNNIGTIRCELIDKPAQYIQRIEQDEAALKKLEEDADSDIDNAFTRICSWIRVDAFDWINSARKYALFYNSPSQFLYPVVTEALDNIPLQMEVAIDNEELKIGLAEKMGLYRGMEIEKLQKVDRFLKQDLICKKYGVSYLTQHLFKVRQSSEEIN